MNVAVNETLAELSNLLVYSAMTVYTPAFVLFAVDLASGGRRLFDAGRTAQPAAEPQPATVAAGAAGSSALDRPVAEGDSRRWGGARGPARPLAYGSGGEAAPRRARNVAVALTALAFALHLGAVVCRGLAAGRVPWGNMYEFQLTGSMVVAGVFLAVLTRRDLRFLGTFVTGLVLLMLGVGLVAFYVPAGKLVPALQSYWLVVHVSVAVLASGLLTLSCLMSVLQLVQARRQARRARGERPRLRFLDVLPPAAELEIASYRITAIGFVLWTFTLMAGAIWAEKAWGRYWGWDTKEVWTFVIWVIYAGYLHARATKGWDGTRAAVLSIVGYAAIVFNFTIVNVYFSGFHSYSGL